MKLKTSMEYAAEAYMATSHGKDKEAERLAQIAVRGFQFNNDYISAGNTARDAGLEDIALEMFDKAIAEKKKEGNLLGAALVADMAGISRKANDLYETLMEESAEKQDYLQAKLMAEMAGLKGKAKEYLKAYKKCWPI